MASRSGATAFAGLFSAERVSPVVVEGGGIVGDGFRDRLRRLAGFLDVSCARMGDLNGWNTALRVRFCAAVKSA